jgi:alanyl aminopeptidase
VAALGVQQLRERGCEVSGRFPSMSSKILASWRPEWSSRVNDLNSKFNAIDLDKLTSTRRIRQPTKSASDIASAFDNITYDKGVSVIRMFEMWTGETSFQQGIRTYLKQHAFGNATESDFPGALSSSAEPELTSAFSTFTNQPGVPVVTAEVRCASSPVLELKQARYLDLGLEATEAPKWHIPVCVRHSEGSGSVKECFLLKDTDATFSLTKASVCPEWLVLNAETAGYHVSKERRAGCSALS